MVRFLSLQSIEPSVPRQYSGYQDYRRLKEGWNYVYAPAPSGG
jgi:hypothetical protein